MGNYSYPKYNSTPFNVKSSLFCSLFCFNFLSLSPFEMYFLSFINLPPENGPIADVCDAVQVEVDVRPLEETNLKSSDERQ